MTALLVIVVVVVFGACCWFAAGQADRREAERERLAELRGREQRERIERRRRLGLPELDRDRWDW